MRAQSEEAHVSPRYLVNGPTRIAAAGDVPVSLRIVGPYRDARCPAHHEVERPDSAGILLTVP